VYFGKEKEYNENNCEIYKIDSMNKLKKLREGIKNGTIVKEYQMDGTYIWKKIRK
jgi:hypothetical protein